jgi:hypothetical protein
VARARDVLASVGDMRLPKDQRAAAKAARRDRAEAADQDARRKAAAAAEARKNPHIGGTHGGGVGGL